MTRGKDAGADAPVTIRAAVASDRAFVLAAASRLAAFGSPPGRTPHEIVEGEARTLRAYFGDPGATETLLVAETAGDPAGFLFLEVKHDYFTGAPHGHIGILVVTKEAEGRGVGGALVRAAEDWARAREFSTLTLNVFEGNHHARGMYEHVGFRPDTVKYLKRL